MLIMDEMSGIAPQPPHSRAATTRACTGHTTHHRLNRSHEATDIQRAVRESLVHSADEIIHGAALHQRGNGFHWVGGVLEIALLRRLLHLVHDGREKILFLAWSFGRGRGGCGRGILLKQLARTAEWVEQAPDGEQVLPQYGLILFGALLEDYRHVDVDVATVADFWVDPSLGVFRGHGRRIGGEKLTKALNMLTDGPDVYETCFFQEAIVQGDALVLVSELLVKFRHEAIDRFENEKLLIVHIF